MMKSFLKTATFVSGILATDINDAQASELNCNPTDCTADMVRAYNEAVCNAATAYHGELVEVITRLAARQGVRPSESAATELLDWSEADSLCRPFGVTIDQAGMNSALGDLYDQASQSLSEFSDTFSDEATRQKVTQMASNLEWLKTHMAGKSDFRAPDIEAIQEGDRYQYEIARQWKFYGKNLTTNAGKMAALEFLSQQSDYLKSELEKDLSAEEEKDAFKAFLMTIDLLSQIEAAGQEPSLPGNLVHTEDEEKGEVSFRVQMVQGVSARARDVDFSGIENPEYTLGFNTANNQGLLAWQRAFNATFLATLHYELEACGQSYQHPKKGKVTLCDPKEIFTHALDHTATQWSRIDVSPEDGEKIAFTARGNSMKDYDLALDTATVMTLEAQQIKLPQPYIFPKKTPGWFEVAQATGQSGSCPNSPNNLTRHPFVHGHLEACRAIGMSSITLRSPLIVPTEETTEPSSWMLGDGIVLREDYNPLYENLTNTEKLTTVFSALGREW